MSPGIGPSPSGSVEAPGKCRTTFLGDQTVRSGSLGRLLATSLSVWLVSGAAGAADRITSLVGETRVGGASLTQHGEIPSDEIVETQPGARCSFLMSDGDAVVQICDRARLRLHDDPATSARIIELEQGELRATVGRRGAEQPLEVHTPAAIATLPGAVLHVKVDARTGDTTLTSLASQVHVASSDPRAGGGVVLTAGDQVTIRSGEAPGAVRSIDPDDLAHLGGCPSDEEFHLLALRHDRNETRDRILDHVTLSDIPERLPPVSVGPAVLTVERGDVGSTSFTDPCIDKRCVIDEGGGPGNGRRGPRPCNSDREPGDHCLF